MFSVKIMATPNPLDMMTGTAAGTILTSLYRKEKNVQSLKLIMTTQNLKKYN